MNVVKVTKDAIIASPSLFRKSRTSFTRSTTIAGIANAISGVTSSKGAAVKKLGAGDEADNANKLFCRLAEMFYERFKKENVIDKRRKADFIENGIPNAPPLTEAEANLIAKLMGEVEVMKAKRIAGTVNDSVEKFIHRDEKGGAAWGVTVAKMDVAAITLFTEVSDCVERSDEVAAESNPIFTLASPDILCYARLSSFCWTPTPEGQSTKRLPSEKFGKILTAHGASSTLAPSACPGSRTESSTRG